VCSRKIGGLLLYPLLLYGFHRLYRHTESLERVDNVPCCLVYHCEVLRAKGGRRAALYTQSQHDGRVALGQTCLLNSPDNVPYRPDRRVLQLKYSLYQRYIQRERLGRRQLGPCAGQSLLKEVLGRRIYTYVEDKASLGAPARTERHLMSSIARGIGRDSLDQDMKPCV
jgi:hypothetical protein